MAQNGITDILIANQIVGAAKIARLASLLQAQSALDLCVAVDHVDQVAGLRSALALAPGRQLRCVLEIDIGLGRAGVAARAPEATMLARHIQQVPGLVYVGVMGYEGHMLLEQDLTVKRQGIIDAVQGLVDTAKQIERETGLKAAVVSAAGTGSFRYACLVSGLTEIEAGGCVFSDQLVSQHVLLSLSICTYAIPRYPPQSPPTIREFGDWPRKTPFLFSLRYLFLLLRVKKDKKWNAGAGVQIGTVGAGHGHQHTNRH